jgi:predicted HNH restriction endonuclease
VQLILHKGARCEMCGYRKNFAAPEFHHNDPDTKLFQLDLRSLSNREWSAVLEEAGKCRLLCSNCHAELHNPDCGL